LQSLQQTGEETMHTGPYGALPILIISQDTTKVLSMPHPANRRAGWAKMAKRWDESQEELKKLSTHSRRIIAKGSGHGVQGDRRDLILKEVPLFIEQIRGTAPQPTNYGSTTTE
jgi:hypothetical protein